MGMAAANSWLSVLSSSGRCSHRFFSASLTPSSSFFIPKPAKSSSSPPQKEAGRQKLLQRSKNEGPFANADGRSRTSETGRSQLAAIKSFGLQKKGKGVLLDSKDQQVETGSIQDSAFLNAVVKVYCTHTAPDYSLPWQKQRQYTSTGSAFMIGDGKLLTNAHCVEHDTQVWVYKFDRSLRIPSKLMKYESTSQDESNDISYTKFRTGSKIGSKTGPRDPPTVPGNELPHGVPGITRNSCSKNEHSPSKERASKCPKKKRNKAQNFTYLRRRNGGDT